MGFSLVARSGDYSLVAMRRLFIVVASRVVEHRALGLQASGVEVHGLSCPATCGIFLDQGPPAFLTTGPPQKSPTCTLILRAGLCFVGPILIQFGRISLRK